LAITSPLPINDNGAPYPLALTNSTNGLAMDFTPDGRMDLYNYNAAEGSVLAFYDLGSLASLPFAIGHAGWRAYDDAGNMDTYTIIAGDLESAAHTALSSRLDFGIMLNQNAAGGNAQPGTHFYLDPTNGLSLPGLPITDQYGLVRIGNPGGKTVFQGSISNNIEVLNGAIGVGLAPTNAIMIDTSMSSNNGVMLKNPWTPGTLVGNYYGSNGQGVLDLYAADGATVNDAVLTVVAGGLRRWLETHHGHLGALRVKVPVSLHGSPPRPGDDAAGRGNRDSFFCLDLPLGSADPLERLAAKGQMVAYRHEGFFFAMDTYREYLYLNGLWDAGHAPWASWQVADAD
jgi:hypothetical protein